MVDMAWDMATIRAIMESAAINGKIWAYGPFIIIYAIIWLNDKANICSIFDSKFFIQNFLIFPTLQFTN